MVFVCESKYLKNIYTFAKFITDLVYIALVVKTGWVGGNRVNFVSILSAGGLVLAATL